MAISTNSIIHYTDTLNAVKSILSEGFRIKYCAEVLRLGEGSSRAAHPMISFCDIPLSDSKQHFNAYGSYGIGLSKLWAVENGVNPVLYIDRNSLFADSVYELIKERRKKDSNLTIKQKREILQIKSYAKNYSGTLNRNAKKIRNYRFYDEREWRLVPDSEILGAAKFSISLNAYHKNKEYYNDKLKGCRIVFEPQDISYIIVKSTEEISDVIKHLRSIYSSRCDAPELDILFSKICSAEQIISDY